ncbi:type IX secretion system periplasmic lipoprotein PorW/SprE [Prevotella pectinovora]|uniref:type IX secretion system periplasmic lipoprotein PorW/SprE n=1 Tax=Prevotella pectinovora TaxID=1602169 RepID=UPI0009E463E9|nr:tetratricopeptide repeat protein [Prevotella pectinovora]
MTVIGCSTQKNTSASRWWHSFNARYNTYYNGSLAYIDASLEKENGNKDNFTEMLPLYTVGNKASRELGKGNFDRAIEKCQKAIKLHSIKKRPEWNKSRKKNAKDIEWLNRREYNPFLWKAWLLMGRSQFMKGSFDEAASTFAYMSRLYATQPAIYGKARAWLARCYVEQDWLYDAEDVITKIKRDSLNWRAQKDWDYTYADYYIRTGRYQEAIPYLRKVIKHEGRRKQRAREWYLMGQLQTAVGNRQEAYKAYRSVIRQQPPYELEFNARIAMTEVMATGKWKQMVGRLKRMARNDNNKEYLDQVYYAIGNIYMNQKDTVQAIAAYEKGNAKSTRNGIEKGVLLLTLGDIYWAKEDFSNARRCYGEAIGLLDKDRKDYKQLSDRSKILDELVPHTDAVHLQDSLQALAKMSEKDRNAAIDRVIEALKKKEKEERDAQAEAEAQRVQAQNGGSANADQRNNITNNTQQKKDAIWYFYNPMAVSQGKATFQKLWGKRENVDDWQRVNKTVVAQAQGVEEMTDEMRDSLANVAQMEDSLANVADSAQNDPHKREYYLAQIPFTEEQVEASNLLIMDGLYNAGVIFKDKLDNLVLSEKELRRLADDYPTYEHMDNAYYHLFLLYSRMHQPQTAASYLEKLKSGFPDSEWTTLLSDPHFVENARYGVHLEDSLYAATYDAFKADKFMEVKNNVQISATRFPLGANRDKFIFFDGMAKLNSGDAKGCVDDMKIVVDKYPKSEVSTLAGMIVNGVNAGRKLHGGKFDISDVWERRAEVMSDSDSIKTRKFTAERNVDFSFIIAYQTDSINENQLLFELAKYNFSNFLVRNFEIAREEVEGLERMVISGFKSYDEALQYARQLYSNNNILRLTRKARAIIISDSNKELLGTQYSYNDYDKFYEKHFVPLRISTMRLLSEPETIEYEKEPESEKQEENKLYNGGVIDDDTFLQLGIPTNDEKQNEENDGTIIPIDSQTVAPADNGLTIPVDNNVAAPTDKKVETPVDDNTFSLPDTDNLTTDQQETFDMTPERQSANDRKQQTANDDLPNIELEQQAEKEVPKPTKEPAKTDSPAMTEKTEKTGTSAKTESTTKTEKATTTEKPAPKKEEEKKPQQQDNGIHFTDDADDNNYNIQQDDKKQKKQQEFNLEDDYYELDGF